MVRYSLEKAELYYNLHFVMKRKLRFVLPTFNVLLNEFEIKVAVRYRPLTTLLIPINLTNRFPVWTCTRSTSYPFLINGISTPVRHWRAADLKKTGRVVCFCYSSSSRFKHKPNRFPAICNIALAYFDMFYDKIYFRSDPPGNVNQIWAI